MAVKFSTANRCIAMGRSDRQLRPARSVRSRGELDEVGGLPDPLVEEVSDAGDVVLGRLGVPPPGVPAADAAPDVAGGVVLASFGGVEPGLVAFEAGAPGGEGDVEVVGRGGPGVGEGPLPVGIADLHQADGFGALAGFAVGADGMAGSAVG